MRQVEYRREIDGLRAIAVLSVVLYHAKLGVLAGQVGVDVFFVISGYLITLLLYREWNAERRIDFAAFYARRVRRIIPALVVVVAVTFAAAITLLSPHGESTSVAESAAASLMFAGNIYFHFHTGGYFDPGAESLPLLHLWSLGVEEQFYLVWPLVIVFMLRRWPAAARRNLCIAALGSFAFAEFLILRASNAAFYEMLPRFWELAAGGLVALAPQRTSARPELLALGGLVITLAAVFVPIDHFPGLGAVPAVAGAALLLHAIHGSTQLGRAGALLQSRFMVFFGLISYSLYLWHWPLLAFAHVLHPGDLSLPARISICLAAAALAWLSYRFVEQPFRRPDGHTSNLKLVSVSVMSLTALAVGCNAIGNSIYTPAPPDDLASRTANDQPRNYRLQCHYTGLEPVDPLPKPGCASTADLPVRVAIWGDSHALAWQPFAWALAAAKNVAAIGYTRDACAPALGYDNGKRLAESSACREFNERVVSRLNGLDVLIVTAAWPMEKPDFAARFAATLEQVSPRVAQVIVLGPTPRMRASVPSCIAAGDLAACATSRRESHASNEKISELLTALQSRLPNLEYVDLEDFFCDQDNCPPLKDGYGLYWDSNHVSSTAARAFGEQYLSRTVPHWHRAS